MNQHLLLPWKQVLITCIMILSYSMTLPQTAFVANNVSGTVSVIDLEKDSVINEIAVGPDPRYLAVTPDESKVYVVSNSSPSRLTIIDPFSQTILGETQLPGVNNYDIKISPDGAYAYVGHDSTISTPVDGGITKIDVSADTILENFFSGVDASISSPRKLVFSLDGSKLFVLHRVVSNTIDILTVLNTSDYSLIENIEIPSGAWNMSLSKDGSKLYIIGLNGSGANTIIDTETYTITPGNYSEGVDILVNSDDSKIYSAQTFGIGFVDSKINIYNAINSSTSSIQFSGLDPIRMRDMDFSPDSAKIYVTYTGGESNFVSVADVATETELKTILVGTSPQDIVTLNLSPNLNPQEECCEVCSDNVLIDSTNSFIATSSTHETAEGPDNTAVGYSAGLKLTLGKRNFFIGPFAGTETTTGVGNSFMGYKAGAANISGDFNIAIGDFALRKNRNGDYIIAIGSKAGFSNYNNNNNIYFGQEAGYSNDEGENNIFFGRNSGYFSESTNSTIAIGYNSYQAPTTGFGTVAIGVNTLKNLNDGTYLTFLGFNAGQNFLNGDFTVAVGPFAGDSIQECNGCVFLGPYAGFGSNGADKFAVANGKDSLDVLLDGNFDTGDLKLKGIFSTGGGIQFPDGTLQTTSSSQAVDQLEERLDSLILSIPVNTSWVDNGNSIYTFDSVGIGTANPEAKLDIRGNILLEVGDDPIIYTGTGTVDLSRYLLLVNTPDRPTASGLKTGGLLVGDAYVYANPGPNDLVVKGKAGIGTPDPETTLDVRGNLLLDPGTHPFLFVGTGSQELNRFLQIHNSPDLRSASGLKAGGLLVSNDYNFASPGKNDLVVAGNVGIGVAQPSVKLDIDGDMHGQNIVLNQGIQIGFTNNAVEGNIRYNNGEFEGYNGSAWVPFTSNSSNASTNSSSAISIDSKRSKDIAPLEEEIDSLRAQLAEAHSEISLLKLQVKEVLNLVKSQHKETSIEIVPVPAPSSENRMNIFPNPTQGKVELIIEELRSDQTLEILIHDAKGTQLKRLEYSASKANKGLQLDLSQYAAGTYHLNVKIGSEVQLFRVVKS